MLLIHRSKRAANAVRTVSPAGELFVASVVICMILAAFGDAVDPQLLEAAGLEFMVFDLGGELSVLGMRHWHLLQLLLAGAVFAGGIVALRTFGLALLRAFRPGPHRALDKVPIETPTTR
jgi:hypothetical protein